MNEIKRAPIAIAQLLLLLSRPTLEGDKVGVAQRLCGQIDDWDTFAQIATEKFCVPWVFDHLSTHATDQVPTAILDRMRLVTVAFSMQTMRVAAEQVTFQKTCLERLGVHYAFIKGPSLAARYHKNPAARFSRDIDLLVAQQDHERVIQDAISLGYQVWDDPENDPKIPNTQELRALLRYEGTVTLVSKDDVVIEVHRDIDKFSGLFEPAELLATTEEISTGNTTTHVLPTAKLFCYICYHHSRHIWSKLHWIADLDAMITHPDFEKSVVLAYADERGLRPTVEACLEFHQLTLEPETWSQIEPQHHGKQMLDLCLDNLMGDLAFEYAQRAKFGMLAIPFDWMLAKRLYWPVMARHLASRLKPNYTQFAQYPLPAGLQFLYYFTRPLGAVRRRLGGSDNRK